MERENKRQTTGQAVGKHAPQHARTSGARAAAMKPGAGRRPQPKGGAGRKAPKRRQTYVIHTGRIIAAACVLALVLALILWALLGRGGKPDDVVKPEPTVEVPQETAEAEPEPTPVPTELPTPEPEPVAWTPREMGEIAQSALPDNPAYGFEERIVANGQLVDSYSRAEPITMGQGSDYAQAEGIFTFRGNNYRDTASYGTVPNDASGLSIVWSKKIGEIDGWRGVGWTGQASVVRWPAEIRQLMNINDAKKAKDGLVEVIYGTLDGHIYFLDLDDGQETRGPIAVPSSIKGSVSVDPRGLPLLYCGQGIPEVKGREVEIGTRIFSLIDQSRLFFLDGRDKFALRKWYAFDCSPLIDAGSDTMIQLGENGIVYTIQLNTQFDAQSGALSIHPVVDRMVYKSKVTTRMGMENSPAIYDHYAYYADNSGLLTCLDLNTLEPVWLGDVGDDTDASIVLEEDDEGVWLYTACELDLNGMEGNVYCRKFNALTGEEMWKIGVPCYRYSADVEAGSYATPTLGKGSLSDLVYFNIARVQGGGGRLGAIDKKTGQTVWQISTGGYSWSSPVCVYDGNGRGYILFCNSNGILRMCDGLTGEEITQIDLGENIEASPVVFGDMLVIGTWGAQIFGVRITA